LFSMKRIFRPSPAATDPSPEKLPVEPPEIVTLRAMSTDRALWRVANRDLEIGTGSISELPTGGGRASARNIILMLIICSSKRKICTKRR